MHVEYLPSAGQFCISLVCRAPSSGGVSETVSGSRSTILTYLHDGDTIDELLSSLTSEEVVSELV